MIAYDLAVLAGVFVDAWLLALVAIRGRRPWLQATFAALALAFIVNGAAFVGTSEGLLSAAWEVAVLWTLVLAYPLTAILVLALIHGESLPRRRPAVFALLALAPIVVLLTPSADWGVAHAYEPNLLSAFLFICLGAGLAEAVYERLTSVLFAADAFWLTFGVAVLIVGGPVWTLEFQDLGILQAAGSNAAAPIALGLFALVLFHAEPYPSLQPARAVKSVASDPREPGASVVLDEAHPKYALDLASRAQARGEAVLVLGRAAPSLPSDVPFASLTPTRPAAARSLGSAAEFYARTRGGLVVLSDLGDLAATVGWPKTLEAVVRIRGAAQDAGGRFVLSAAGLTAREKEELREHGFEWWTLPDPAEELEAVLAASFGPGARRLLDAFCASEGLAPRDLNLIHVDAFCRFLERAVSELGASAADAAARAGLRSQATAAEGALRAFAAREPHDLADGTWPSRATSEEDRGLLVTAAGYWKGKEMEELFRAANELRERTSLFERARTVFQEQLGDAGEGMLRAELAKLGRTPDDLRPEDVSRLADRAAVDLAALADVVDVPQEKVKIQSQVESIRRRLAAIAGDER